MLFIDSLRELPWLDAPLSLCERQPPRGEVVGHDESFLVNPRDR
jgi:hypothetical protein